MNLKHNILALIGKAKNQRKIPLTSLVFFLVSSQKENKGRKKKRGRKRRRRRRRK
jgi:hypothetical protein